MKIKDLKNLGGKLLYRSKQDRGINYITPVWDYKEVDGNAHLIEVEDGQSVSGGDIVNVLELLKEFDENMVLVWESDGKEIQEHREDKFVTILS